MADLVAVFSGLLLLVFSLSLLGYGMFTAYFGAGKSRKIGLGLTIVGLLGLLTFVAFTWGIPADAQQWNPDEVVTGIVAVLGALLGGFVALVLFLVTIMRA